MMAQGYTSADRVVYGRVAEGVLRPSIVPVMVVPRGARAEWPFLASRLIVPLDGSASAEQALAPARYLAEALRLDIDLVHVLEPNGWLTGYYPWRQERAIWVEDGSAEPSDRAAAQRYLDTQAAGLEESWLQAETQVAEADPITVIRRMAEEPDVCAVVMTARGAGDALSGTGGSVTQGLLSAARVPVVVVPALAQPSVQEVRATRELSAVQEQTLLVTLSHEEAALTRMALRPLMDNGSLGWTAHQVATLLARLGQAEQARQAVWHVREWRQAVCT